MSAKVSYFQLRIGDIIRAAGGIENIIASTDPYSLMIRSQDREVHRLLQKYLEVGELSTTDIQDFCDNLPV